MEPKLDISSQIARLIELLERHNTLLERQLARDASWKRRLMTGMFTGLGSVLGATLVVSIIAYVIKPLSNVDLFKPTVERVLNDLDREHKGRSGHEA